MTNLIRLSRHSMFWLMTTCLLSGPIPGRLAAQDVLNLPFAEPVPAEQPAEIVDIPAVAAIRDSNPTTPAELLRAIRLLIQLDRGDLAARYLEQLSGQGLDDAAMSRLHEQFGTALMLRLMRVPELAPAGAQFAQDVLEAAKRTATDPQRLAGFVAQLGSDERKVQLKAADELLRSEAHAVAPLVGALAGADPNAERLKRNAAYVLTRLGGAAVDPLLAFLSGSDATQRVVAIQALGRIGEPRALAHLVRPLLAPIDGTPEQQAAAVAFQQIHGATPRPGDALTLLESAAARAYAGDTNVAPDIDGLILTWTWDEPNQTVTPFQIDQPDAAALYASRHYRDLSWLNPDDQVAGIRNLVARLEVDQSLGGLDQPLRRGAGSAFDLATQAGVDPTQSALDESLRSGHRAAAIGAAEVLEHLKDASVLRRADGRLSPLARALSDRNRRVRFAAARAIVSLSPTKTFPGASRLAPTLGHFSASTGQSRVLIYHPIRQRGRTIAGLAAAAGFEAEVVTNAADLMDRAKVSPDWEVVMISDVRNDPSVWSILEALRDEPMTRELPVILMTHRPGMIPGLERTADSSTRAIAVLEPLDSDSLRPAIARALRLPGRDAVDVVRRMEQAASALGWLKQLADQDSVHAQALSREQGRLIDALYTPELSAAAAEVLARIPTPQAQVALADLASQNVLPLGQRQAAAKAFGHSIEAFGLLMTSLEIQRQYERYNNSKGLDQGTQELLGSLLDSIEAPSRDPRQNL